MCDIAVFFDEVSESLARMVKGMEAEWKEEIGKRSSATKTEHIAHIDKKVAAWAAMITDACSKKLDEIEDI